MAPGQSPLKPLMKQIRRVGSLWQRLGSLRAVALAEYRIDRYHKLLSKRNVLADYEQRDNRVKVVATPSEGMGGEGTDSITNLLQFVNEELQNRYGYLREWLGEELVSKYVTAPDLAYDAEEWLDGSEEARIKNQVLNERLVKVLT